MTERQTPDVRRTAAQALMRQEKSGYSNLVLKNALDHMQASARDRAFFSALFYGTVERLVTIDFILSRFLSRPLESADAAVRAVLRTGLYQALWMDSVPLHAAVDESVALVRRMGKPGAAGFVNAVLRRASAFRLEDATFANERERLCVQYSVSPSIAALLQEKLSAPLAEETLRASFSRQPVCLRANTLKTTREELLDVLAKENITARPGPLAESVFVESQGDLTALPAFQKGLFHVQGLASQLACAALAVRPGETVLDLCAAPGGKSVCLAQDMRNEGVLYSCDAAKNRLPLITSALKRLGVSCAQVLQNDAAAFRPEFPAADAVLCDVPCSGLGVLAKKPDVRLKDVTDLSSLTALQARILETASSYVKPGGRLLYSTCTLNPEENSAVVLSFLAAHPAFSAVLPRAGLVGQSAEENLLTLYPHKTGTDGFFIALLQKASG